MMKYRPTFVGKSFCFGLIICLLSCSFSRKEKRVLYFSDDEGSSIIGILLDVAQILDLHIVETKDPQIFVEDALKNYSAIILHKGVIDSLNHRQQVDLERYVLAGGSVIGIELQTKYRYKWPWMEQLYSRVGDTLKWESHGLGKIILVTTAQALAPQFLQETISDAIGANKWPDYKRVKKARVPAPDRFSGVVLVDELNEPMELEVLDNGDVLFIERGGKIRYYHKDLRKTSTAALLNVDNSRSNGLNGLAMNQDFGQNHWVYLSYTPRHDPFHQHISRFLLVGDSVALDSEKVVMKIPINAEHGNHAENALEFDRYGNLYIGMGDFTYEPTGYAAIDERKGHERSDAQRTAANSHDYRGKILRIHPESDGSYTIPEGNLFPKDGSQGKPEIYIMGCRNPYRFSIDPLTNILYWGDLGPDAGVDSERGPKGYDEINQAREPGFYGWPYFVADNKAYPDFDFEKQKTGPSFDPASPYNDSPNNTGISNLPPAQPALLWYPYDITYEFPYLGKGGMNIMAGPVYRYDAFPLSDHKLPEYYDGKLIIYDWVRNWTLAVTFDEHDQLLSVEPFLDSMKLSKPVDMTFGPDGSLYVLEYGTMGYAANKNAQIRHITYAEGNRPPQAHMVADKEVGAVPLTVSFSAEGSLDYDKDDRLRFSWFLDNEEIEMQGKEIRYVFEKPGIYHPTLRVTDQKGASSEATIKIMAGNAPPEITLKMNANQSFYWGVDTLRYQVMVRDQEDGSLADGKIQPSDVKVGFSFQPKQHSLLSADFHQTNDVIQGEALVDASGCRGCHALSTKSVGPSYQAVAERYDDTEATFRILSNKIIEGGKGNWPGNLSMPAHPYLSREEARKITAFILSMEETITLKDLPTQGMLITNRHSPEVPGDYVLQVSYKDKGAGIIEPIQQTATFLFRSPHINATVCDNYAGALLRAGSKAWILENDGYLQFNNIDLSGIRKITFRTKARVKGKVTLRLDDPEGPVMGTAVMNSANDQWLDINLPVEAASGIHDLYFVWTTDDRFNIKEIRYLFMLDTISFGRDKLSD